MRQAATRGWVIAGLVALIVVVAPLLYAASRPDRSDVYAAALDGASELERTPIALTVTVFDVEQALAVATRGSGTGKFGGSRSLNLKVRSAGEDSRGDLYEITSGGRYPVCMIVNVTDALTGRNTASFPTAYVENAAC